MNPITLFLEQKITALEQGHENARQAIAFLVSQLNQHQDKEIFFFFVDKVLASPPKDTHVVKVFTDCYQLFVFQREGNPRLIRTLIFFNGKVYDNFLIRLDDERKLCELEDIDMGEIKNHGIASVCLKNLETVLRQTHSANRIIAGLAPRDYERRQHLYYFYQSKNGYEIRRPVSRTSWGLVEKRL
ncbi:hypothetical protein [Acididesulfobacillus acetoxydans]|uniref:hypothetical protein n=1 Tax=Acididesulfobacillus acetoxydans TaxID=1561005 RepID=UPI001F0EFE7E|nr:hypothetical protein [Acididesulfobacillus acetoxydans]